MKSIHPLPTHLLPEIESKSFPWRDVVAIEPGESLTSLLARQSRAYSMSIHQFLGVLVVDTPRKLPDFEMSPPNAVLAALSERLGFSMEALRDTMLSDHMGRVTPGVIQNTHLNCTWRPCHSPWLIPNGWYGSNPYHHQDPGGIPYCLLCFAEAKDPWFPVMNRLAVTVVCERHRVLMADLCPRCGSRISPYLLKRGASWTALGEWQQICLGCKPYSGLRGDVPGFQSPRRAHPKLLVLQSVLHQALKGSEVEVPQIGRMSALRFLGGVRYLHTAATFLLDHGFDCELNSDPFFGPAQALLFRPKQQPSFEFLTLGERIRRMHWFAWFFERPLDRWHLLYSMPGIPRVLAKHWKSPWEAVDEEGNHQHKNSWQRTFLLGGRFEQFGTAKNFFLALEQLELGPDQTMALLGNITRRQFLHWRSRPSAQIPADSVHRMEHFLRIWNVANQYFGGPIGASRWLKAPNRHRKLAGASPLDFLTGDRTGRRFVFVSELLESVGEMLG